MDPRIKLRLPEVVKVHPKVEAPHSKRQENDFTKDPRKSV
jgi:hypothetical protein